MTTTHRTALLTLAASIAAVGTATSTATAASCKTGKGEVIADVQASGGLRCGTARTVADVFWQNEGMRTAEEHGDFLSVTDTTTGITAEAFSYRGWQCVRSVEYRRFTDETGERSEKARGTAKCSNRSRTVRWRIVDESFEA